MARATTLSVGEPDTNTLLDGGPYRLPSYFLLEANILTVGFRILRDMAQEVSFSMSGKNLLGVTGPAPGFSGVDFPARATRVLPANERVALAGRLARAESIGIGTSGESWLVGAATTTGWCSSSS